MVKKGQPYTSGNWLVKVESEESFIDRWTAFTECPLKNAPGAETFILIQILIQNSDDLRRFVSFGAWDKSGSGDGMATEARV